MEINIILGIIIIALIIYIVYLQNLHYNERKGLYRKFGIEIDAEREEVDAYKVKNHLKKKALELEKRQGGE